MNLLVVDNFDSFTYTLVDYLRQAGATCRVVRNDAPWDQLTQPCDAVMLSPGPGTPRQAGRLMDVVAHFYERVPMLGVCLGHQAIGSFFGAQLTMADRPMHGKVSTITADLTDTLFAGLPAQFSVTRYHSLVLRDLPDELVSTAQTDQNEIMALRHRWLPLRGVQFHPEAILTEYGLELLKNWVTSIQHDSMVDAGMSCTGRPI
jgi:anthranilate synthase component 2